MAGLRRFSTATLTLYASRGSKKQLWWRKFSLFRIRKECVYGGLDRHNWQHCWLAWQRSSERLDLGFAHCAGFHFESGRELWVVKVLQEAKREQIWGFTLYSRAKQASSIDLRAWWVLLFYDHQHTRRKKKAQRPKDWRLAGQKYLKAYESSKKERTKRWNEFFQSYIVPFFYQHHPKRCFFGRHYHNLFVWFAIHSIQCALHR